MLFDCLNCEKQLLGLLELFKECFDLVFEVRSILGFLCFCLIEEINLKKKAVFIDRLCFDCLNCEKGVVGFSLLL